MVNYKLILFTLHLTSFPSILTKHFLTPPLLSLVLSYNPFCMKPKPNLTLSLLPRTSAFQFATDRLEYHHAVTAIFTLSLFTQSFKGTFPLQSFSLLYTFPLLCPQLTSFGPDYPTLPISHSFLFLTHFCESPKAPFFTPTLVHSLAYYLEFWFFSEPLYESPAVLFFSSCFSYVFIVQSPQRTHTLTKTPATTTHPLMGHPGQPIFSFILWKLSKC